MNKNEWYKEPVIGQRIAVVRYGSGGIRSVMERKVERLTKTQIVLDGGHLRLWRKNGRTVGDSGGWFGPLYEPWEQKHTDFLRRRTLIGRLTAVRFGRVDTDTLECLDATLRQAGVYKKQEIGT